MCGHCHALQEYVTSKRVYYIVYARLLLPCLEWGSVLCSYEQSKCNLEAGSRLLHPLAQELPPLPGLLSSLSDTARSNCIREALKCWFSKSMRHSLSFQSTSPGTVALVLLEAHCAWVGTSHPCVARTICFVFGLQICIWIAGLSPTTMNTSKQFHAQIAPGHANFEPWWLLFPWTRESTKEGLMTEIGINITNWRWGRQEELTKATNTCAIRWCCRFITRDTAICMLPNTATTSKILSSKEGAVNV